MNYDVPHGDFSKYDGGHLIPDFLGGGPWHDNIIPMSSKLNRAGGEWYKMEETLRDYLNMGKKIDNYHVKVNYNSPITKCPSSFKVEYDIDGNHFAKIFSNAP
jgi:hypothetical protein